MDVQNTTDRKRDNFSHWKSVVGLPQMFPKLVPLNDGQLEPESGFYMGFRHEPVIQAVLESVTNARLAVIVDPGHGCTTLSRYVYKRTVESAVRTRTIAVRLSVDDFDVDASEYVTAVFERCRDAIVASLIMAPWERPLKRAVYAGLIGASGQTEQLLAPQRMKLAAILGLQLHSFDLDEDQVVVEHQLRDVNWEAVGDLAPRLAADPPKLIYDVGHHERIEISLQVDLSSTRYKDAENFYTEDYHSVVGRLSSAIKAVHEQEAADARSATPVANARSMLGIMLFTSEEGLETFTSEWDQEFDRVSYPIYGPPDVFAILAYHYPQRVGASGIVRTQAMVAIMSDEFVTNAYDRSKSLHAIIEALERSMLDKFNDWANARIRLE